MPPSESDSVIFFDGLENGGEFVVQWDRYFNNGEENRLKMQLTLVLDGTITFLYKNFHNDILDSVKDFPVLIGVKDGFSVPEEKPEGMKMIFQKYRK